eukprot:CAMPEP_0118934474 /NCGR_PEP_ID=MMETSP1169-20130426/13843_1 /TAXON_ID=36882 /ORGANISM="Pyramimonas obovata, Strain CCMP722" /LENGTH=146 /DNA_ID=CAMNT_0006877381 /DNA_START=374 /DNA_END=811 /DNA_ORIENTATION=-
MAEPLASVSEGSSVEARATSGAFVAALAEHGQAHGADEADVDAPLVAEARGAEVDPFRSRHFQEAARVKVDRKHGEQVLEEALEARGAHVEPPREVRRLLQEGGLRAPEHAPVHRHPRALRGEEAVHDRDVLRRGVRAPHQAQHPR